MSRYAKSTFCPRCHCATISGLDEDYGAYVATVDPWPVDRVTEVLALLADRRTYEVTEFDGRLELTHRTFWRQTAPGRRVVVEHRCGLPLPACGEPVLQRAGEHAPLPETPPF